MAGQIADMQHLDANNKGGAAGRLIHHDRPRLDSISGTVFLQQLHLLLTLRHYTQTQGDGQGPPASCGPSTRSHTCPSLCLRLLFRLQPPLLVRWRAFPPPLQAAPLLEGLLREETGLWQQLRLSLPPQQPGRQLPGSGHRSQSLMG